MLTKLFSKYKLIKFKGSSSDITRATFANINLILSIIECENQHNILFVVVNDKDSTQNVKSYKLVNDKQIRNKVLNVLFVNILSLKCSIGMFNYLKTGFKTAD